jgi:hypothetical protein
MVSFAPRPLCAVVRAPVPTAGLHVLQVRCLLCRESSHDYSIIQPTVYSLFECETWSVSIREEDRVRVFENRVLRSIVGPKRDEVRGEYRRRGAV